MYPTVKGNKKKTRLRAELLGFVHIRQVEHVETTLLKAAAAKHLSCGSLLVLRFAELRNHDEAKS